MKSLAVAIYCATLAIAGIEIVLIARSVDVPSDQWGIRGYEAALALAFGSVGALLAVRRPANPIGWLCLTCGCLIGLQGVLVQYAALAGADRAVSGPVFLARWVSAWVWVMSAGPFVAILPLVFPDGRLPSPRWRPALALSVGAMALQVGVIIANTEPFGPAPASNNPAHYFAAVAPVGLVGYAFLSVASFISVGSLVDRYRHAGTVVRQQIKWVVYAFVLIVFGAAVGMSPIVPFQLFFLGTAFLGAGALAIAVLRYRLYEIDTIISRTLVYGGLSALLAGIYTAAITLSQRVFVAVTGERSDAAIVFTTLVIVSLFTPLKTRLQAIVDRRLKPAAPSVDLDGRVGLQFVELLRQLADLRDIGILTAGEFEAKKAELLSRF